MARNYVRENVPLSRFGVLVAQLESIVASAAQQSPEPLLCFDLLSDLIAAIEEEPKESILLWQRKCEDALYSLLTLGARRPVRHLASVAMARIISRGDAISIYSRASTLQGFLSDGKRSEPQKVAGAAQCLGELYRHFGRRITLGLLETASIAMKLIKLNEEFVRQEALHLLQNALEGSGGSAASSAYTESFRLIMRFAVGDKSFLVRIAAARCLKAFATIGGPGLGVGELENSASFCVKALDDPVSSVRDAFAEALASLLALGMNPDAQVQPRGKGSHLPAKKIEGGLQRYLTLPFTKANGSRTKDVRLGITLSWVFFLQAIRLKYLQPDSELQSFALQVIDMLRADGSADSHALACVLYILRVGVTDQMTEPSQRNFLVFLGKQLQLDDANPFMKVAALRTLSYTLKTLGEVPSEFKEILDDTVVAAVSHSSQLVRIEAALTLRALAEVDPTCVGGLVSYVVTMLNALRENLPFEKGSNLQSDLNSLQGQATVLAAFVSISPKLPLGYPARLPRSVLEVSKKMLLESSRNPVAATVEQEAGWYLLSSPEPINKILVNQMLQCFALMFASQDSGGMLSLLGTIEQCLKAGKKKPWHSASVTNICVGLLAGFKALLLLRPQPLGLDILNSAQAIFQSILGEGDICPSQRRASSEGLGLLSRLGNDVFTARMTRVLLGDLTGPTDSNYAGSVALALGCIHRSAGGMALSTLVPATVSSISLLAKSSLPGLQIWSLHGLLLTIEAAGLSYVSHVQETLGLALDILLSEDNGWVVLQQGVGRLINAVVTVLGPELAPGSIFFSRCKSVIAEISSGQETATMLENVRFTQQLVLFAPQAVSVHSHVQTLLPTLSSRQPTLRHLAVSTLRHLIEKDPASIVDEQIEDELFHMLDEETDSDIGDLVRATIMRLLYASCPYCPSRWISICRGVVLATSTRRDFGGKYDAGNDLSNGPDGDATYGHDNENMVSSSRGMPVHGNPSDASHVLMNRDRHLRYRTRLFAAECLSHLPVAVGGNTAHFDLSLAREHTTNGRASGDWLVRHVQELISLAYQISTIQFENMQPVGVRLLSTILDKKISILSFVCAFTLLCGRFERTPDPELPEQLLLEQYQAQLVSAVRTALDSSTGPILLEAGLQLATKILTNGIIKGDQVAIKRIFSLISRPLDEFGDLYYPSFAEWVSCKIKIRLLAAHASLKCYTYTFLRRHHSGSPEDYLALLPLFSKSSSILGNYWVGILCDYSYVFLNVHHKKKWNSFLAGIQSPLVSSKIQTCLEESWPIILRALVLDAVPVSPGQNTDTKDTVDNVSGDDLLSGYSMVELDSKKYLFVWGFSLLVLFRGRHPTVSNLKFPRACSKANHEGESTVEELSSPGVNLYEIVLPVFQFLLTKRFANAGFLTMDICRELLQVFSYSMYLDNSWDSLSVCVISQIVQNCPKSFFQTENFSYLAMELCTAYLFKVFKSTDAVPPDHPNREDSISALFVTAETLVKNLEPKKQLTSAALAFLLIGYKCMKEASTDLCLSKVNDFFQCNTILIKKFIDKYKVNDEGVSQIRMLLGSCLNSVANLSKDCIERIHLMESKSDLRALWQAKLAFSLEQTISLAKLVYDTECLGEHSDDNTIHLTTLKNCIICIQTTLTDSNIRVQAIGLQVLKGMVQKGPKEEDNAFVLFFTGECITDIFVIIEKTLKKSITRDSAAIVGECLRLLVLLQTVSKDDECQRGFVNLFLEATVLIIMAPVDSHSKEFNDLRSTAIRLVSHLAQLPSSGIHFKDALLAMPVTHRQQLQGVIRASISQDQSAVQAKATIPFGEIDESVTPQEGEERVGLSGASDPPIPFGPDPTEDSERSSNVNLIEDQELRNEKLDHENVRVQLEPISSGEAAVHKADDE